jgi:hypothetical protein
MLVQHIALISKTKRLDMSELTRVSAAIQKQITRDLGPIWDISATADAFEKPEDIPEGYWILAVTNKPLGGGIEGYHEDPNGDPFAIVQYDEDWSVAASHEAIEMLVDPFGRRKVKGASPKPGQGEVIFLVEACDPSEAYSYTVNGIRVSDFYTPNFFDPVTSASTRYSYMGVIREPRQVLPGGYISWFDPQSDAWWQMFVDNDGEREFTCPGKQASGVSSREFIDRYTRKHLRNKGKQNGSLFTPIPVASTEQELHGHEAITASRQRARAFEEYLDVLAEKYKL